MGARVPRQPIPGISGPDSGQPALSNAGIRTAFVVLLLAVLLISLFIFLRQRDLFVHLFVYLMAEKCPSISGGPNSLSFSGIIELLRSAAAFSA